MTSKIVIDRLPSAWKILVAVIIEEHQAAIGQLWVKKRDAVECRLVQIHVDRHEAEGFIRDF